MLLAVRLARPRGLAEGMEGRGAHDELAAMALSDDQGRSAEELVTSLDVSSRFLGASACGTELAVFVSLLSEISSDSTAGTLSNQFYNRLCEAMCRLTTMERAVLFLYDDGRERLRPIGSHGIELQRFSARTCNLEDVPMAQQALATDEVIATVDDLEGGVPEGYEHAFGVTTLTCTPVSAGGKRFGVIFADRGGGCFQLPEHERYAMWTLGKMSALAASARLATRNQERAREITARLKLGREIHERVMQRLFAVSLVLAGDDELTRGQRERCRDELRKVHEDLRRVIGRPLGPQIVRETGTTLRQELVRLRKRYRDERIEIQWQKDLAVPPELEGISQWVLTEAISNVRKHAVPTLVDVSVYRDNGDFVLDVVNDGVRCAEEPKGIGLALAGLEALQYGGVVESGPGESGTWRVRLAIPSSRV